MFNGFSQGLAARKQNDSNVIYTRYLQYSQRRAPRLWLRVKALVPRVTVTNRSLQAFRGGEHGRRAATSPRRAACHRGEAAPAPALRWTGRRCRGAAATWLAERVPRRPRHPRASRRPAVLAAPPRHADAGPAPLPRSRPRGSGDGARGASGRPAVGQRSRRSGSRPPRAPGRFRAPHLHFGAAPRPAGTGPAPPPAAAAAGGGDQVSDRPCPRPRQGPH